MRCSILGDPIQSHSQHHSATFIRRWFILCLNEMFKSQTNVSCGLECTGETSVQFCNVCKLDMFYLVFSSMGTNIYLENVMSKNVGKMFHLVLSVMVRQVFSFVMFASQTCFYMVLSSMRTNIYFKNVMSRCWTIVSSSFECNGEINVQFCDICKSMFFQFKY